MLESYEKCSAQPLRKNLEGSTPLAWTASVNRDGRGALHSYAASVTWAILEHIVPPPIRRIANPHVVRDYIHQESHAVLRERVRERFQVRLCAELRVDGAMGLSHRSRGDVWQGEGHQRVQEIFAVMAEQYDIPTEARVQYIMISSACLGRSKIGQAARGTTCWATLPMSIWCARVRPCVPIMMRSTCWSRAVSRIP
jgi:hypothetical protein